MLFRSGGAAFIVPSAGWLTLAGVAAAVWDADGAYRHVEAWAPILLIGLAATILGFGLAYRRYRMLLIGTVLSYLLVIVGIAIWLFVFHPPYIWGW